MADRLGRNIALSVGIEDSYGAGQGTPKEYVLGRSTLKVNPAQTITQTPEIRGDPNPAQPVRDILDLDGQIALVSSVDSFPLLLNLMCGNSAMTLTVAPFLWTTKILSNALKSCVVERWDATESKSDITKGVIVTDLTLSWKKKGGPLITNWGLAGVGATPARNAGTRVDAAPTVLSAARHSMRDCTLTIDGATTLAANVVGFDIAFQYGVERKDGCTGNAYAEAMIPGTCSITGSLTVTRPTTDTVYALCDGADHIVLFKSPQPGTPTRYIQLQMSQVRFDKTQSSDETGPGLLTETITMMPYFTTHADGTACIFTVSNDKGTAY